MVSLKARADRLIAGAGEGRDPRFLEALHQVGAPNHGNDHHDHDGACHGLSEDIHRGRMFVFDLAFQPWNQECQ